MVEQIKTDDRYSYVVFTTFNASHSLTTKENKHSHTFRVKVVLEEKDTNFDTFTNIENIVKEYLSKYKGKYLNECASFQDKIPTIETICSVLYTELLELLQVKNDYTLLRFELGDAPTRSISVGKKVCITSTNHYYDLEYIKEQVRKLNYANE